jgi:hypothetical protein
MIPDGGPGVPEAEGRALLALLDAVGVDRVDRLWRFPVLRKGRREWGIWAAGVYTDDPDRHLVTTLSWKAEETGKGVTFEPRFEAEGEAPPDRIPRVIAGVLRRMDEALAVSTLVEVAGDPDVLAELAAQLGTALPAPIHAEPEAPAPFDPEPPAGS